MVMQASLPWKRLRRYLVADPGRFAGGSAVSDPFGLLAIERERLVEPQSPHDAAGTRQPARRSHDRSSRVRDPDGLLILLTPGSITRPGPG